MPYQDRTSSWPRRKKRPPAGTTSLCMTWQISPALTETPLSCELFLGPEGGGGMVVSQRAQCAVEKCPSIVADQNNPTPGELWSPSSLLSLSSNDGMDALQALQGTDASTITLDLFMAAMD
ncbi:hypothetical protein BDK51DRAFT_31258, partial [Blyttiomyces helicus]